MTKTMKLNKTLVFAAFVAGSLFTGSLAVQAQEATTNTPPASAPSGAKPRGGNIQALLAQLNLTDDQKPKVKAVFDDQMQKIKDIRADSSLSQDDRRTKMKELRDNTTAQLKDILTPDQFATWQKIAPGHRRPTPPADGSAPPTNAPPATN
jgi:periplasmic protein CpxP/Spy